MGVLTLREGSLLLEHRSGQGKDRLFLPTSVWVLSLSMHAVGNQALWPRSIMVGGYQWATLGLLN